MFLYLFFFSLIWGQSPFGIVSRLEGEVTTIPLFKRSKASKLVIGKKLENRYSYSTGNQSRLELAFSDWTLYLGSETTASVTKRKNSYLIQLYSGSIHLNKKRENVPIVVRTPTGEIITQKSQSWITYHALFDHTSLYVEDGMAQLRRRDPSLKTKNFVPQLVHQNEFSEVKATDQEASRPQKIKEEWILQLQKQKSQAIEEPKNDF